MNVVFGIVRVVEVDDELDVVHVQSTSSDVSGNQNTGSAVSELFKHIVSLLLALVTVDADRGPSIVLNGLGDLVHLPFGLGEDDGLVLALRTDVVQQTKQFVVLLVFLTHFHNLLDVVVGR
uniref:Uncharacterized protein n=1 Tax=Cacopsylla melanoneura TaxID=428564 RepID=A0A8D8U8E9_9HEMI